MTGDFDCWDVISRGSTWNEIDFWLNAFAIDYPCLITISKVFYNFEKDQLYLHFIKIECLLRLILLPAIFVTCV